MSTRPVHFNGVEYATWCSARCGAVTDHNHTTGNADEVTCERCKVELGIKVLGKIHQVDAYDSKFTRCGITLKKGMRYAHDGEWVTCLRCARAYGYEGDDWTGDPIRTVS